MDASSFLPVSREDMQARGWWYYDFLVVTADAYVDHPSFGAAIIARVLEAEGWRTAVLAQPDWHSADAFLAMGKPRYGVFIGGGNIDSQIIDHIADSFNLKIGLLTSEKLKMTVASLYTNDKESMVINGRDIATGRPRSVAVSSVDIYEPVKLFADKVAEYAGMILAKLPAEVSAAIWHSGIYLSGGSAKIMGIDDYLAHSLQMDINLSDEPQMAVILGGGRTIGYDDILECIKIDY